MGGLEVAVLGFVFPGETFAAPDVGPAVAAGGLGGAFFEGVVGAVRVGVGGGLVEQVAEVDEVLVAGGTLVAGVGAPFGDEGLGGHGGRVACLIDIGRLSG